MKAEVKVARIGNSRGVRLPASALKKYGVGSTMIMEERAEGILLRPAGPALEKLGWAETAGAMEAEGAEDWGEWDEADADGLSDIPWEQPAKTRVEGRTSKYGSKARAGKEVFERYEMRWASLDPSRGSEMAKTRPVVLVSLDELNARLQTVTICPLTSRLHPAWRCRLQIQCGGQPADIAVDRIRTVSKTRLGTKIGSLTEGAAAMLRRLITEMCGE